VAAAPVLAGDENQVTGDDRLGTQVVPGLIPSLDQDPFGFCKVARRKRDAAQHAECFGRPAAGRRSLQDGFEYVPGGRSVTRSEAVFGVHNPALFDRSRKLWRCQLRGLLRQSRGGIGRAPGIGVSGCRLECVGNNCVGGGRRVGEVARSLLRVGHQAGEPRVPLPARGRVSHRIDDR